MKKIIINIKRSIQRTGSILAGLLIAKPQLRPIPVRVKRSSVK